MLDGRLAAADTRVQRSEAEATVRDERAHAARFGEPERFAVTRLGLLGIEALRVTGDVAEQMPHVRNEVDAFPRGLEREVRHAPGLVGPSELQQGTAERMVAVTVV